MSNGRKLGLSRLTSLSLDSLEAGVGSMTSSVHLSFYSYFFRVFHLSLRGYLNWDRIMRCLCSKEHFCVARSNRFCEFGWMTSPDGCFLGESHDSGRRMG